MRTIGNSDFSKNYEFLVKNIGLYVVFMYILSVNHLFNKGYAMANLTITLDDDDKKGIADFCEKVGMTISGLYNVFTKQVLREGRIPFEISVNRPNHETVKALEESDELYAKYLKNPSKVKTYTVNEAVREMKSW